MAEVKPQITPSDIQKIMSAILSKQFMLGPIVQKVPTILDLEDQDSTAYTDGRRVVIGGMMSRLSLGKTAYVMLHEWFHILCDHMRRGLAMRKLYGDKYNHNIANICADCYVYGWVDALGFGRYCPVNQDIYIPKDHPDYHVWAKLPPNEEAAWSFTKLQQKIPELADKSLGDFDFETLYEFVMNNLPKELEGSGKVVILKKGNIKMDESEGETQTDIEGLLDGDELDDLLKDWQNISNILRDAGNIPAHLARDVATKAPIIKIPWRTLLKTAMRNSGIGKKYRQTYARINKRLGALNQSMRLPHKQAIPPQEVIFAIDTSGSMGQENIAEAYGVLQDYMKSCGGDNNVRIISHDTEITECGGLEEVVVGTKKLIGGGGTWFKPVVAYVEAKYPDKQLIWITDGYAETLPRTPYTENIIWLIVEGGKLSSDQPGKAVINMAD